MFTPTPTFLSFKNILLIFYLIYKRQAELNNFKLCDEIYINVGVGVYPIKQF